MTTEVDNFITEINLYPTKGTLYEQLENKLKRNQSYYDKYLLGNTFADIQHSSDTPISWTAVKSICMDFANVQNKLIIRLQEIDTVCDMYFRQNKNGIDIAKELGVTRQAVYKIIRKKYDLGEGNLY